MNKIFNPNNIFAFPLKAYDLQNVFFCKELLEERFFCISEDYESSFYRSPNALREAYQVVLEEDVMNYIKKLDKHIYECILFNFLYKIKDELETLSFDEFNKILTDEEIKKEFKNFGVSFDGDAQRKLACSQSRIIVYVILPDSSLFVRRFLRF